MKKIHPVLKWAGGKWNLCPGYKELGLFPRKYERYFEPFLGGASVFLFNLPKRAFLSDTNDNLINTYKVIRDEVDKLIELLKEHKNNHNKKYYYKIRNEWKKGSAINKAAKFIYLNKTCFNGLFRVNSKGQFNVPIGKYKNPSIFDENNLRAFSSVVRNINLKISDYKRAMGFARKDDFIYFDPPYQPLSTTSSFTNYTEGGFDLSQQIELKETFDKLNDRGCLILESNSNAPEIQELYKDYHLTPIMAPRFINARASGRKKIQELAITNFKPKPLTTRLDQF